MGPVGDFLSIMFYFAVGGVRSERVWASFLQHLFSSHLFWDKVQQGAKSIQDHSGII